MGSVSKIRKVASWEVFRRFAKSRTEEPQRNNCPQTKASRAYVGTGTGSGFDVLSRESRCLVHPRMPGFDPRRPKVTDPVASLLRARHERPRGRRAAEKGDELTPVVHSITSSARSRVAVGTSRPSALAVLRLSTVSYLVGCSTGMSPGFAPRNILSAMSAARRNSAGKFAE